MRMLICMVFVICLTGCSVLMAMSGEREPDLGSFGIGSHRSEVEMQLGSPLSSVTLENGQRVDVYEYQIGNEPSAGRAIAHGAMDVLTWGVWEIIGTPVEGFIGERRRIRICYDENNRIVSLRNAPQIRK